MNDAQLAIIDIKQALEDYGSDIKIRTITKGSLADYDPRNPTSGETKIDVSTKAIVRTQATKDLAVTMPQDLINNYETSMVLYSDTNITKENKIVFEGLVKEIVYINKKMLQNTTISYELLVK